MVRNSLLDLGLANLVKWLRSLVRFWSEMVVRWVVEIDYKVNPNLILLIYSDDTMLKRK